MLLGYLKYKPVWYSLDIDAVKVDLEFIRAKHDIKLNLRKAELTPTQKSRVYSTVLNFCGYQDFKESIHQLGVFVAKIADDLMEPREIFDRCVQYLMEHRVILPSYAILEKIIHSSLRKRQEFFQEKLLELIPKDNLLELDNMATAEDSRPLITLIKKFPKTFKPKEMDLEVSTFYKIQTLFYLIESAVIDIGLSKRNIEYFASMVTHYSITKLRALPKEKFYLYLVCFLYQRYYQMSDVLIQAFIYHVRKIVDEAQEFARNKYQDELANLHTKIKKAGTLLSFYADEDIEGDLPFSKVREKAYKVLEKEYILPMSNFLGDIATDVKKYQWQFYEDNHNKIVKTLRKLFLSQRFDCRDGRDLLNHQILVAQEELTSSKLLRRFDLRLIKPELKPFLIDKDDAEKDKVNMVKAEMLLYVRLKDRLERGEYYVQKSLSFKRYEDDLIPTEKVPEMVESGKLASLRTPISQLLAGKIELLESKLSMTAERIQNEENPSVIFAENDGKTKWTIKRNSSQSNNTDNFYRNIPQQHIGDILAFANNHTDFSSKLTHVRMNNKSPDLSSIIACIVANGSRYGTHNMANLCNLSYDVLRSAEKNYLRMETLQAANDVISNHIARLSIFKYYNIQEDKLHASYDGQRFESRFNTISTNFCSKYFGRGKGVSAVSLIANHIPVNAQMMGLNGHESYYLYDLLFNNTSDIQPDVVSTDNHGTNQFNFALLDFPGWSFAPRYANIGKVLSGLFSCSQSGSGVKISLQKPINTKLIENDWPFIQQIMVSLQSKHCSQSTIG